MSLTRLLEKNLLQFQQSQETKKTLIQWKFWLQKHGITFSEDVANLSSELLNWRDCLSECEQVMQIPDELSQKLTSPEWLRSQGVILFALVQTQHYTTLRQRLEKLEDAVTKLQEQVRLLYATQPKEHQEDIDQTVDATTYHQKTPPHYSSVPKDLAVLNLKAKKNIEQSQENTDQIIPIDEAYLTMSQWIKILQREGNHAFDEVAQKVEKSSHRISFMQMKVRLMRYTTESHLLEQALQDFEKSVGEGILLDSEIQKENIEQIEKSDAKNPLLEELQKMNEAGLKFPSDELYQDFTTWVAWFAEQGFLLQELTTQDLTNHSSHQISFVQFCKRIERQLEDKQTFKHWIAT